MIHVNCHERRNEWYWKYRVDSEPIRIGRHKYICYGNECHYCASKYFVKTQLKVPDQWQLQNPQRTGLTANVDRPLPVWSDLNNPIILYSALLTARANTWPESRVLVHTAESYYTRLSWTLDTSLQVWSSVRNLYYCRISNLYIIQSCTNFGLYIYIYLLD
jgi:hypothetical protein